MSTIAEIDKARAKVASLESERMRIEMSDDFAYSNGRIAGIDKEIREARFDLQTLLADRGAFEFLLD